jgi:S1-C subfamily serine protease
VEIPVQIRSGKKELWKKHPRVDVAAMFISLPENVVSTLLTTNDLMDDNKLNEYEIHPGLELLCLGYPFGAEANSKGFPILRSGRIASYPLTPTKEIKTFLFDFTVFPGNSGGPVYFFKQDPAYGGVRRIGSAIYGIMGLVVRERNITQKVEELYEKRETVTPLQLGEVIHATFIKELIASMDAPNSNY